MLTDVKTEFDQVDTRWQRLMAKRLEVRVVDAFRFLRSRGIEPILIKGWAAARNYPESVPRFYVDIDLSVSRNDFESARSLLATADGSKLAVDLHDELRHFDSKSWDAILRDSELVDLDGYDVRIPCAEDHLRILAVHWLNDGGERKDRLWDIYYAIENPPDNFDWDKCLGDTDERRRGWLLAAIGLTHRYLGLPIDHLPFASEARDLPPWLVKTVEREWESGVRLVPLVVAIGNRAEFLRQVRKRLPPNPLQSTIEMEGDIRNGGRLRYQLGSIKKRILPSIRNLTKKVLPHSK